MTVEQRFASESMNRPKDGIKAEDVLAAFSADGAKLRETKQHLGSFFLAAYCVGTQTGEDVHMSICEYKDEKTAKEGSTQSDKAFAAVPNRHVYRNGTTTLTMRLGKNGPEDQALAKKLVATFEGMKKK